MAGFVVFLACASCHGHDAESLRGFGVDLRLRLTPGPEHVKAVLGGAPSRPTDFPLPIPHYGSTQGASDER